VASNPEFLREGAAIRDFKFPDRIIVRCDDSRAKRVLAHVYRPLSLSQVPILYTNEMADLCEKVGGDVQEVARGIGLDNRIGTKFLHAGPGFGGSCFPKDVRALIKTGQDHNVSLRILEAVAAVNDNRKRAMARKIGAVVPGGLRDKTIGVLGLSFKPNTDDLREAPALALITALQDMGADVRAFDPAAMDHAKAIMPNLTYCESAYDCAEDADALVIVTEWEQFRALDLPRLQNVMATPTIVDLRNVYHPDEIRRHGFVYVGIGRGDDVSLASQTNRTVNARPLEARTPARGG
jgi:UDPglucose 6-dehydrogenase